MAYMQGCLTRIKCSYFSIAMIVGAVILIWSTIWMVFVTNDPSTNRFVSEQEKMYLAQEINFSSRKEVYYSTKGRMQNLRALFFCKHEIVL